MRLLSIIITYYPDLQETTSNIRQFIDPVDKLIVWENTPPDDRNKYTVHLPEYDDKIITLSTNKNEGIAYPLNRAIEYGVNNGYTHLLTMDQDSQWEDFASFKEAIQADKHENVVAFCPPVNSCTQSTATAIETCITSGTVYDLKLCTAIGNFREDYIIDAVDLEYCFKSRSKGLQLLALPAGLLNHKRGYASLVYGRWRTDNYSPFRLYYITRNNLWLCREYPRYFNKRFFWKNTLKRFPLILLGESDKLKKLNAIVRGLFSGLTQKWNTK